MSAVQEPMRSSPKKPTENHDFWYVRATQNIARRAVFAMSGLDPCILMYVPVILLYAQNLILVNLILVNFGGFLVIARNPPDGF